MMSHLSSGEPACHHRESSFALEMWTATCPSIDPLTLCASGVSSLRCDEKWAKRSQRLFCGLALNHPHVPLFDVPVKGWPSHSGPPPSTGWCLERGPRTLLDMSWKKVKIIPNFWNLPVGPLLFSALFMYFLVFSRGGFQMGSFRLYESGSGS